MSGEDIQWDVDPSEAIIQPLPEPNRADIRSIPIGSEILLIQMGDEGVTFSGHPWTRAMQIGYQELLADEDARFDDVVIFYVVPPPTFDGDLPSEDEVIKAAMVEHIGGGPEEYVPPPAELVEVLRLVVRKAREGMVVNPF